MRPAFPRCLSPSGCPALALLASALLTNPTQASEHTYLFTGLATVGAADGGPPVHSFTGRLTYQDDLPGSTTYVNNAVVQGFRTRYLGAVDYLGITLDNGEQVEALGGWLDINNIQQAETGAPVPTGLTLQVWTSGASGSINGLAITNLYLAFLPVAPAFSWDGLDTTLGGNAEQLLGDTPSLLPANIDPAMTGTAIPEVLPATFINGLFLGTNHGLTNTVNTVYSFSEQTAPVPEPPTAMLLALGTLSLGMARRARRRRRLATAAALIAA